MLDSCWRRGPSGTCPGNDWDSSQGIFRPSVRNIEGRVPDARTDFWNDVDYNEILAPPAGEGIDGVFPGTEGHCW